MLFLAAVDDGGATIDEGHAALKEKLSFKNKLLRTKQLLGPLAAAQDLDTNTNRNISSESSADPLIPSDSAMPLSVIPHGAPLDRNFPSSFLLNEDEEVENKVQPRRQTSTSQEQEDMSTESSQSDVYSGEDDLHSIENDLQSSENEVQSVENGLGTSDEDVVSSSEDVGTTTLSPMMMMMVPELRPVPREQLLSMPDPVRRAILQPQDRQRLEEAVLAEVSAGEEDRSEIIIVLCDIIPKKEENSNEDYLFTVNVKVQIVRNLLKMYYMVSARENREWQCGKAV